MGTPRRVVVRRSIAAAALVALFAAGCHSGGGPATPSAAPGPYTRADVDAIVLGPDDAPGGTAFVDGASGFQDLQAFARDATERAHLQEDGFQVGHLALFFPSGHANGGAPEPLTNRSAIVQGIAGLFRDPAGAERSLERYEQRSALPPAPGRPRHPGGRPRGDVLRVAGQDIRRSPCADLRVAHRQPHPRRERQRSAGSGRGPGARRPRGRTDLV